MGASACVRAADSVWQYLKNILIGLDQLLNTLFHGWPDETLSSRCWRLYRDGRMRWPRKLVDSLLFFDADHCRESYRSEILRRQCPPEMRQSA